MRIIERFSSNCPLDEDFALANGTSLTYRSLRCTSDRKAIKKLITKYPFHPCRRRLWEAVWLGILRTSVRCCLVLVVGLSPGQSPTLPTGCQRCRGGVWRPVVSSCSLYFPSRRFSWRVFSRVEQALVVFWQGCSWCFRLGGLKGSHSPGLLSLMISVY